MNMSLFLVSMEQWKQYISCYITGREGFDTTCISDYNKHFKLQIINNPESKYCKRISKCKSEIKPSIKTFCASH